MMQRMVSNAVERMRDEHITECGAFSFRTGGQEGFTEKGTYEWTPGEEREGSMQALSAIIPGTGNNENAPRWMCV